jgi:hypothetical protein
MMKPLGVLLNQKRSLSFSLSPPQVNRSNVHKGVTYCEKTGKVLSCVFCRIHAKTEPGRIFFFLFFLHSPHCDSVFPPLISLFY